PSPNAALRMLAGDGSSPRMADDVTPLEIVGRILLRAVRLFLLTKILAPADDRAGFFEHQILTQRVLPIARVQARQREAPRIDLRRLRRRHPARSRSALSQIEGELKFHRRDLRSGRRVEARVPDVVDDAVDHPEREAFSACGLHLADRAAGA